MHTLMGGSCNKQRAIDPGKNGTRTMTGCHFLLIELSVANAFIKTHGIRAPLNILCTCTKLKSMRNKFLLNTRNYLNEPDFLIFS